MASRLSGVATDTPFQTPCADKSETAIIIATEPVFAALFSVYFGYEVLGFISYVGAGIVVFAVIFCELSRSNKLVN